MNSEMLKATKTTLLAGTLFVKEAREYLKIGDMKRAKSSITRAIEALQYPEHYLKMEIEKEKEVN